MDAQKFKTIKLSDKGYFDLFIGKRVVKRDLVKMEGTISLYSANVFKPIGLLPKSNISDFNNEFILWGIDGDFDFNHIEKGEMFATTDHCGVIRIKTDNIIPSYLLYQLNFVKGSYGYDRVLRASLKNMKDVEVRIPINLDGEIDLKKQNDISSVYSIILDLKQKIKDYQKKLESIVVEVEKADNITLKEVVIGKIMDSPPTNSGLKKGDVFLTERPNSVPVYSATQDSDSIFGWVSKDSKWKRYKNILTWNKDGSAGTVFYRKNEFVPYEKVKLLKIKAEYENILDYDYLKYIVQTKLLSLGFGFNYKCSMDRVLKVEIPIPVNNEREYDLKMQKEIVEKYKILENTKKELKNKLDEFLDIKIEIN